MRILWVDDNAELFPGLTLGLCENEPRIDCKTVTKYEEALDILDAQAGTIRLVLFDFTLSRRGAEMISGRRRGLDIAAAAIKKGIRLFIAFSVLPEREMLLAWNEQVKALGIDATELRFLPLLKETPVAEVAASIRELLGS